MLSPIERGATHFTFLTSRFEPALHRWIEAERGRFMPWLVVAMGAGVLLYLSLRVEQLSAPRSGETLRGAGQLLSAGPTGIVARGVLVGEDGRAGPETVSRVLDQVRALAAGVRGARLAAA